MSKYKIMLNKEICSVKECSGSASYENRGHKGFCSKHYQQICNHGRILERTRCEKNEVIDCGNYYEICLYNIKNIEIARTKIDKEDLRKVKKYKWYLNKKGGKGCYVRAKVNKRSSSLHQLILGKKIGMDIDHINHIKIDNRKQNLRYVTKSQNQMNQKNVKGYSWYESQKEWRARIQVNHKIIHLGCFKKEEDAINARKKAEQKYFKEFAYNIIN